MNNHATADFRPGKRPPNSLKWVLSVLSTLITLLLLSYLDPRI